MAAKPRSARSPGASPRCAAIIAIATTIGFLAFTSSSLANAGGVYFDTNDNAAAGDPSLLFNAITTGADNVGLARSVMPGLTTGDRNVATGNAALFSDTTGSDNVATGAGALFFTTAGGGNVATGTSALLHNSTGSDNVATGHAALSLNREGDDNVATGNAALSSNTGDNNVATGSLALVNNTTGVRNVATGNAALAANTTGKANVALGHKAGKNLTTGSDNIDIANPGKAGEAGTIRIGNNNKQTATLIAGISDTILGNAAQPVVVKSNGQLGVAPAASAATSAKAPGVDRKLRAKVSRLQRAVRQLRAEVKQGR